MKKINEKAINNIKKSCVIIDMQNDFITGSLANTAAQEIVEPIARYIGHFDGDHIFLTQDTHYADYLETPEGKNLPIRHCLKNTDGWKIDDRLIIALQKHILEKPSTTGIIIEKETFGSFRWKDYEEELGDEVYICGTVSEICVISNVLILKAMYPNKKIIVMKDLCAGLSTEGHLAAMTAMRSCQVEVI